MNIMKKLTTLLLTLITSHSMGATDPKSAYKLSQEGKAVLVDVREKEEISQGMVKGALWFPLSKVKNDPNWLNEFKKHIHDKKVFLYCRSGKRSAEVQKILEKNGVSSENIGGMLTLEDLLPISLDEK